MNADAAEQCIDLAIADIRAGRTDHATKLLRKSLSLHPTTRAQRLLDSISSRPSAPSSAPSSNEAQSSRSAPTPASPPPGEDDPEVKRVLASPEDDYYAVLGLPKGADITDVKKAYKRLALRMHPDRCHAKCAEDAFKKLGRAYACLGTPSSKETYDKHGIDPTQPPRPTPRSERGAQFGTFPGRGGATFASAGGWEDIDPDDIFRAFFSFAGAQEELQRRPGDAARARAAFYRSMNRGHGRQQQHEGPLNAFSGLLPLLMLVGLFALLTSLSGGNGYGPRQQRAPLYSMERSGEYSVERKSSVLGVRYYVTQETDRDMPKERTDSEIDSLQIRSLQSMCNQQRWRGFRDTPACDELAEALHKWQKAPSVRAA